MNENGNLAIGKGASRYIFPMDRGGADDPLNRRAASWTVDPPSPENAVPVEEHNGLARGHGPFGGVEGQLQPSSGRVRRQGGPSHRMGSAAGTSPVQMRGDAVRVTDSRWRGSSVSTTCPSSASMRDT
jgi:hypothetical protein